MTAYLRLFGQGFCIVFLTAVNAYQVPHLHYGGAGVVGWLISWIWFANARTAGRSELPRASLVYATGAAVGTVAGMWLAGRVYHP